MFSTPVAAPRVSHIQAHRAPRAVGQQRQPLLEVRRRRRLDEQRVLRQLPVPTHQVR